MILLNRINSDGLAHQQGVHEGRADEERGGRQEGCALTKEL